MLLSRMRQILYLPFHPILFALSPILFLLSVIIQEVLFKDAFRSIWAALSISAFLLISLRVILRNWNQSAILTSLYLLAFFSYGHIYAALEPVVIAGFQLSRHRYLVPLFISAILLTTWLIVKKNGSHLGATLYFNIVAVASLIIPVATIVPLTFDTNPSAEQISLDRRNELSPSQEEIKGPLPDIYYIVVDEYARGDILRDIMNYENEEFYTFLRERGFYIAEESSNNYMFTALSLGSSLNMDYVQNLGIDFRGEGFPGVMTSPIKQSGVRQILEDLGYSTAAIETGFFTTEIYDVDHYLSANESTLGEMQFTWGINGFESLLIHTSAGLLLKDIDILQSTWLARRLDDPFIKKRAVVLSAFDHLKLGPEMESPIFFFAHIIAPHYPFVFGPNGEEIDQNEPFTLAQSAGMEKYKREQQRYLDQLAFITSQLEEIIGFILTNSDNPPAIILQSDTGPPYRLDYDHPTSEGVMVRFSILNAYYVPDECDSSLYPTISPVNTFRMIFNCYFGTSYDLIDDETYWNFLKEGKPFEFVPVSDILN
jgi:hypothetical protein